MYLKTKTTTIQICKLFEDVVGAGKENKEHVDNVSYTDAPWLTSW